MEKEIRGHTLAYWEANANEDYKQTPISVLKYITILEEELKVKNNVAKSNVSICTCGTEDYAESEKREDGFTYCSKCNKKF